MRRQVLTSLFGTGTAQAIALCAVPILTRYFSPEEFGLFGLFTACVSVLGNVAAMRYELAIVLPDQKDDAASVFALCFPIVVALATLTLLVVIFAGDRVAALLGQPELAPLLNWLPLSVLAFGSFQALNYWATRDARFLDVGVAQVGRSFLTAVIQVTCGLLGASVIGLVSGQVGAHALVALSWLRRTWRRDREVLRPAFQQARMEAAARRYWAFPVQGAPLTLINSFSQTLPLFLLGILFSPQIAGFYVLAQRLLEAPAQLIASSFRQALLPRFARAIGKQERIAPEMWRTTVLLFLMALPAVPVLAIWGGDLFSLAFGAEWHTAGEYAAWLMLAACLDIATPPANCLLMVMERQKLQLVFETTMLIGRAAAIMVGGLMLDPMLAIALFALVGALLNMSLIVVTFGVVRRRDACLA